MTRSSVWWLGSGCSCATSAVRADLERLRPSRPRRHLWSSEAGRTAAGGVRRQRRQLWQRRAVWGTDVSGCCPARTLCRRSAERMPWPVICFPANLHGLVLVGELQPRHLMETASCFRALAVAGLRAPFIVYLTMRPAHPRLSASSFPHTVLHARQCLLVLLFHLLCCVQETPIAGLMPWRALSRGLRSPRVGGQARLTALHSGNRTAAYSSNSKEQGLAELVVVKQWTPLNQPPRNFAMRDPACAEDGRSRRQRRSSILAGGDFVKFNATRLAANKHKQVAQRNLVRIIRNQFLTWFGGNLREPRRTRQQPQLTNKFPGSTFPKIRRSVF